MINVVAAVIKYKNHFFIAQRNRSKDFSFKWEFPGGKVEADETLEEALKREIMEELGVQIEIKQKITQFKYKEKSLDIYLHYFLCVCFGRIYLSEHENGAWVTRSEFNKFDFAPGDTEVFRFL
tara:strand:- start:313 stop:681 length:369 start_codon:yes stop_codon:yes gene_type:complete